VDIHAHTPGVLTPMWEVPPSSILLATAIPSVTERCCRSGGVLTIRVPLPARPAAPE
jgi:hypothetical protein